MTPVTAAKLLALAAAFDNRSFDETTAMAWADALDGLDPDECATAIRAHYRNSTDFVMPAHIRRTVTAAANDRAARAHAWRELQPDGDQCIPMPPELKAQVLEFADRRKLPGAGA